MPSTKEIKSRIKNIQDTKKITNAMYLIASTKMRKAKADLDKTKPYFYSLSREIKRIFRTVKDLDNRYFYPVNMDSFKNGTYGILVITADKGLAGAYNANAIKEALRLYEDHHDTRLYVVGEYGRQYFKRHGIPIEEDFRFTAQDPTMEEARQITMALLSKYNSGELAKIFVVYTDFKNRMASDASSVRLLPFHREIVMQSTKEEKEVLQEFEFTPNVEVVIDSIISSYISGFIFGSLVDSFCAEQNSRIEAMNSANTNSDNLLQELNIEYNRVRQGAITQELTEISAGAKAQKKKKLEAKSDDRYR